MRTIKYRYITLLSGISWVALTGLNSCQQENFEYEDTRIVAPVVITGMIENSVQPLTRALTQDPQPVQFDKYDGNFYIEMKEVSDGSSTTTDEEKDRFAIYGAKSGQAGFLEHYNGGDPERGLVWLGKNINYDFYSWTVPWLDKKVTPEDPEIETPIEPGDTETDDNQEPETPEDPQPTEPTEPDEEYQPTSSPIEFQLRSNYLTDTVTWQNGKILEKLIGAKTGPVNYKENGSFVTLQYRHLVSKIFVKSITLKTSGGGYVKTVQGHITFVNMPDKFTLYPNGKDGNSAPEAVTDYKSINNTEGLKYYLVNGTDTRSTLYVCPELDFSQIEFFVELEGSHGNQGVFWGSFADVRFERDPGTDYDNPKDENDLDSYKDDSHVLHAGEMMEMNLYIEEGSSPGMSCYIHDWNEEEVRSANHHNHKGIYESGEANELAGQSRTNNTLWDSKFELYGDGYTEDGKGIFHIYGDVTMAYPTNLKFEVNNNYIIDGMGYTIQFTRADKTAANPNPPGKITVGRIKDAYLTLKDNEGKFSTLYVDEDFNVWIVDEKTGALIPTTLNLDSNTSTTIDFDDLDSYRINE